MRNLIRAFACRLNILLVLSQLLTEHHLELLSLKGGCTGSSESTLVKMPHCWKLRVRLKFSLHYIMNDSSLIIINYIFPFISLVTCHKFNGNRLAIAID